MAAGTSYLDIGKRRGILSMERRGDKASRTKISLRHLLNHALSRMLLGMIIFLPLMPMAAYAEKAITDDLFGVSFPNPKEGWVCGRWGVMYRTSDGGATWFRQDTGTDVTLVSVFFADPKNGWAVGDLGTIIRTGDGGKTWIKQKCPVPSFYLMDVFFVSSTKGWIVTEKTHILYTDNGGETWNIQFRDKDYILKAVSFSDPLNGWAVGEFGFTYHTQDGGVHWKHEAGFYGENKETSDIEGGNFLFSVTAVDAQKAWGVGIDGYVVRTLDGGKTWKEVKTGAPKTQFFCVASNQVGTVLLGGKEMILVSKDDGKTWTNPTFEPPIKYGWLYRISRRGSSEFVAVGVNGSIYLSDGGNPSSTWHRVKK